ncbi:MULTISPECIES: hypothetical protein [Flavobacterium]|uniref:hypothetical protein n=1 Tax=Flavobacterium TaxID=237 RepID=UPI001CA61426|nr:MULTISPECIES: hypothetical protein [Flavobacterium]MBY8962658.1 hypothetical protein [Flavobacterium coralii]
MRRHICLDMLQEYILEHNLSEYETIILHPDDYDVIAAEFFNENELMIFRPVEVLGTKITEDTHGDVRRNQVMVLPAVAS